MFKFTLSRGNSVEFPMFGNYPDFDQFNYGVEFTKPVTIDVTAVLPAQDSAILIPEVRTYCKSDGAIDMFDLVNSLKFMGYPVDNTLVSYYSPEKNIFINCGKDPLPVDAVIPISEIPFDDGKYQIHIIFGEDSNTQSYAYLPDAEEIQDFLLPINEKAQIMISTDTISTGVLKMEFEDTSTNPSHEEEAESDEMLALSEESSKSKTKRTKERKIGEIMENVLQWRRLYNGYQDPKTGKMVKMSLEAAAAKVGMSKKSLDDYLLQIRFGKSYGFNFNKHANERVGVLRSFVKKNKNSNKAPVESNCDSYMPAELAQLIEKKETKVKPNKDDYALKAGLSTRSKKISK